MNERRFEEFMRTYLETEKMVLEKMASKFEIDKQDVNRTVCTFMLASYLCDIDTTLYDNA